MDVYPFPGAVHAHFMTLDRKGEVELSPKIDSIEGLITRIRGDSRAWGQDAPVLFRGEPDVLTPLLPRIYRSKPHPDENRLLQTFRMMAPSYVPTLADTPHRDATDQWLCLAQHVGLPTRLLDWTENALIALMFAVAHENPVVWMLNPLELNLLSVSGPAEYTIGGDSGFPLTWHRPDPPDVNIGNHNIRGAWEQDQIGVPLPVAIVPPYVHPRMASQRSRFTVHGLCKESLSDLIGPSILKRYVIDSHSRGQIVRDLRLLGVQEATAFPDLAQVSRE